MDFTISQPNEWLSTDPEGHYRITYSSDVRGVKVRPHFHALVNVLATPNGERPIWWFAGKRGRYYSLTTATAACQRHYKTWLRAIKLAGTGRKGRGAKIEALKVKAVNGQGVMANRLLTSVPVWARAAVDAKVLARLFPTSRKQSGETE